MSGEVNFSSLNDTQKINYFNDQMNEFKKDGIDSDEAKSIFEMASKWGKQTTNKKLSNLDANNLKSAITALKDMDPNQNDPKVKKAIENLQRSLDAMQKNGKGTGTNIAYDTTSNQSIGEDGSTYNSTNVDENTGTPLNNDDNGKATFKSGLRQLGYSDDVDIHQTRDENGNETGEMYANITKPDGTKASIKIRDTGNGLMAIERGYDFKDGKEVQDDTPKTIRINNSKNATANEIKMQSDAQTRLSNLSSDANKSKYFDNGKINSKGLEELAKTINEYNKKGITPSSDIQKQIVELTKGMTKEEIKDFNESLKNIDPETSYTVPIPQD